MGPIRIAPRCTHLAHHEYLFSGRRLDENIDLRVGHVFGQCLGHGSGQFVDCSACDGNGPDERYRDPTVLIDRYVAGKLLGWTHGKIQSSSGLDDMRRRAGGWIRISSGGWIGGSDKSGPTQFEN